MDNAKQDDRKIWIVPVGHAVSLFLTISYLVCVGFGLLVPETFRMYEAWSPLLPGFEWLTLGSFVIGLLEAYLYGWYVALVFVPLYNFFNRYS